MIKLDNVAGAPVVGDNFHDREQEQRAIWRRLETDSILLLAPRRVGKTSLLRRLEATAESHGFQAVYTSVSHRQTELEFVEALVTALWRHPVGCDLVRGLARGKLGKFFDKIDKIDLSVVGFRFSHRQDAAWQPLASALAVALRRHSERWGLLVDELSIFVTTLLADSRQRAAAFLNWFRELRIELATSGLVRWVLSGSIGLDTIAERHRLGETINDLHIVGLGAFDQETADELLVVLGRSHDFELPPAVRAALIARVGWPLPYYLQVLFGELRDYCDDHATPPSLEALDAVYDLLLSPSRKSYFDTWVQRLAKTLGSPGHGHAMGLLEVVARDPDGATRQTLQGAFTAAAPEADASRLRFLLDVLERDGYIVPAGERYRFRSSLLRDYWLRRVLA